ncbi:hypothetical protein PSCLAVI8L_190010 [Pseudoclavibacter sp. 8L]|nr:hypothetical protein PSCLAVI8L_190010 [Pseudoclavibacter sp. 8L]
MSHCSNVDASRAPRRSPAKAVDSWARARSRTRALWPTAVEGRTKRIRTAILVTGRQRALPEARSSLSPPRGKVVAKCHQTDPQPHQPTTLRHERGEPHGRECTVREGRTAREGSTSKPGGKLWPSATRPAPDRTDPQLCAEGGGGANGARAGRTARGRGERREGGADGRRQTKIPPQALGWRRDRRACVRALTRRGSA